MKANCFATREIERPKAAWEAAVVPAAEMYVSP
jgi:hypothetical protein